MAKLLSKLMVKFETRLVLLNLRIVPNILDFQAGFRRVGSDNLSLCKLMRSPGIPDIGDYERLYRIIFVLHLVLFYK